MKKSVLLTLIFALGAMTGCQKEQAAKPKVTEIPVRTIIVEPKTIPADFGYVGFAQSSHLVEIRARVEGYLEAIKFKEGGPVKKGDLLFELDKKPFEAALENAKGVLAQQEAILWNATRSVERLEPLYEQKAASRKDLDDAISQKKSAEAAVLSAKAKIKQAELDLSYTSIHSPVDGVAEDSNYREGALITPGPSSLLTTVSVFNPIWINFSVSEADVLRGAEQVKKGLLVLPKDLNFDVEAILPNGAVYPNKGKVSFSSPTVDQKTGTLSVRADLPNPEGVIKPGSFIKVRVLGGLRPNAILIPQHAVLRNAKGLFVYSVKDNKVEQIMVETGGWYESDWIITSGVSKGDQIIVEGVNKVQPGTMVKVLSINGVTGPTGPMGTTGASSATGTNEKK